MSNENTTKVSIINFVKKYKDLSSEKAKEAYLTSIIYKDVYIPYATKIWQCRKVLEIAHITKEGKIQFNSAKEYQLYVFMMILSYTALENSNDSVADFDALAKEELIEVLLDKISENNFHDATNLKFVFKMEKDDFIMNYQETKINAQDIESAVETGLLKGVNFVMDKILEIAQNGEVQEAFQAVVQDAVKKEIQEGN